YAPVTRGFFFSSRRRHTRFSRDWSSDVCSSDLQDPHKNMPRIEDDTRRPRRQNTGERRGDWRRRLLTWGLVAAALVLGFLIPYTIYLNHQVVERFGQLQWQLPTRVYARPLTLVPGMALDAATLKTELDAASYRD